MTDQVIQEPGDVVPNSTLAVISVLAGILGLTVFPFIGSIVAVILGPLAKKEIDSSRGALGGKDLAKAGQILGWIGVGFGVLLVICGLTMICLMLFVPFLIFGSSNGFQGLMPLIGSIFI
jgi:hypothetical protein